MSSPALVVVLSALASGLLLWVLIPQLRRRLLDQPNARSSHQRPTPRGGGLAFVLVAAGASGLALITSGQVDPAYSGLPLLALPLALVGFLDDRHNLPAGWRYGAQLATALLLILVSPLATALPVALSAAVPLGWLLPLPALTLLLIAITAVINFTNFMDGLDGLVAGCLAVALAAAALQLSAPWPLWALVGALLGFLFWNWSPAKLFMGDVGSTFLGAVFAGVVLRAPSWPEALGVLLVATPLLGDACLCVPRRLLAGQPVLQAHRLHLFQRLHQAGWPHARVSSLYISATALLALALLIGGWPWVVGLSTAELLLGLWLDRQVAVPFAAAAHRPNLP
ncbi:glycosyltransferase family 4 protein [Vulcanococcus limneticus Candia 3F8]|nr:glycosyltransferase family 4 protein [Vulcanococcus limneticus MW73D5]MCP9893703.1 glycosyltransferase family 4 protein [Vulcanococcus limneticus Candia 3F8]MCP9896545.1 glycosyltransferase family 4 protein [Vulcanococcus limneticus Candia 3B3]